MNCFFNPLLVASVVFSASLCFGQSASDIDAIARHRQRLNDAQTAWRDSAKISLTKEIPERPKGQGECADVRKLQDKSVVYLEYWEFKVRQVVGKNEMIVGMDNPDIPPIWLSDYATDGFVDGQTIRFVGPVAVDGTKEYKTVLGASKTVRVVKMLTAAQQKAIEDEKVRAKNMRMMRTWTSASGKFTVEARFVNYGKGVVVLAKEDDTEIEVKATELSGADRKYYRNLLRERKNAERASN